MDVPAQEEREREFMLSPSFCSTRALKEVDGGPPTVVKTDLPNSVYCFMLAMARLLGWLEYCLDISRLQVQLLIRAHKSINQ